MNRDLMELMELTTSEQRDLLEAQLRAMVAPRVGGGKSGWAVRRAGELEARVCLSPLEVEEFIRTDAAGAEQPREYMVHSGETNLHPVAAILCAARETRSVRAGISEERVVVRPSESSASRWRALLRGGEDDRG